MTGRDKPNPHFSLTWIRDSLRHRGVSVTLRCYAREFVDMVRDLAPDRRKSRYGDIDFDFEHGVDTTWATISLRTRIREWLSGGQYQPSEPVLFAAIMAALPMLDGFTFIDLGAGKGRTLLMASSYPFLRIIGVELLDELNAIAEQNIACYHNAQQKCFAIESHSSDARQFEFPAEPTVLYLFNPFPGYVWWQVLANLHRSITVAPRAVYVIYHNPVHDGILSEQRWLREITRTHQYVIYQARPGDTE